MKLQLFDNPSGFFRGERCIQRSGLVRVQVIKHDSNHLGLRVRNLYEPSHLVGEINPRALLTVMVTWLKPACGSVKRNRLRVPPLSYS